ncbi:cellulase [Kitasatospora herbaricolor]|uniref:Cellulase n=1 Tax=Kitasatospora herbaricolor TaxID=68217 RepID=A0ABZ1WI35_9ACTN|nr:cellulase [Kitasatospora herbaricolor]
MTRGAMDRFEQELVRMMREGQEETPYEDRHRDRLHAGVQARKRVRTAWKAAGSVLTATGLCVALLVVAGSFSRGGPAGPRPLPLVSAGSVTMTSPGRPASTAEGAPAPYRLSTPGPATGPGRISATRPAPGPVAGGPVG